MKKNRIIIPSNPLNHEGGIVNYYNLFFRHFESEEFELKHFNVGSRSYLFYKPVLKRLLYGFYLTYDLLRFIGFLMFKKNISIVQVSPSLIPVPLIRDGILILLAKLFGKKVIIFYRGWKLPTFQKIQSNKLIRTIFNFVYQQNVYQIVLANAFKNGLEDISAKKQYPIWRTTTAIDKKQIVIKNLQNEGKLNILFLGRIQNLKGIEEIIDAIILLKNQNLIQNFKFTLVGHESPAGYISLLKKKLKENKIPHESYDFPGRVTNNAKYALYASHHIFLLPSYTEGCPNSVLEALASGLFCITTNVGALQDIIQDNVNGLTVDTKSSEAVAKALIHCANNRAILDNRQARAKQYSKEFDIRRITAEFNNLYHKILNE